MGLFLLACLHSISVFFGKVSNSFLILIEYICLIFFPQKFTLHWWKYPYSLDFHSVFPQYLVFYMGPSYPQILGSKESDS